MGVQAFTTIGPKDVIDYSLVEGSIGNGAIFQFNLRDGSIVNTIDKPITGTVPLPGGPKGNVFKFVKYSKIKEALEKVYKELRIEGPLPKIERGKFGSPQRSDGTKGYRLDPGHPNRPATDPEASFHINWWDKTFGRKRNKGLKEGVEGIN